ncbi:MAG TPA: DUF1698 domain-containing protein [Burkholderiales bacterium]|nr:DUF1698 domain-containing protein [Burkholderiales bacterium]
MKGDWDLRGRVSPYLGKVDFNGKRVFDVGCASGFLSFEMEKRGASEVVSLDASSVKQINFLPVKSFWDNFDNWAETPEASAFLVRMKNSYWFAHREFGSNAKAWYGDIYNIPAELGMFDVVVVAQILVHLRDPIKALWSAADRCSETLIIAEGMIESSQPMMKFISGRHNGASANWWHLTTSLYDEILFIMGFEIQSVSTARYRCNVANQDIPITTIVARRRHA